VNHRLVGDEGADRRLLIAGRVWACASVLAAGCRVVMPPDHPLAAAVRRDGMGRVLENRPPGETFWRPWRRRY
jgi:hypothetical protein